MAFYTITDAKRAFQNSQRMQRVAKSGTQILNEEVARVRADEHFDVFLSHCLADADDIVGVQRILEANGQTVYVDWMIDKHLDRSNVTAETAATLRERMEACSSMIIATSDSSPYSKWMPWEIGYFDGIRGGQIAVLPLVAHESDNFVGQEYLGLYPVIERLALQSGGTAAFVTRGPGSRKYMSLGQFSEGASSFNTY